MDRHVIALSVCLVGSVAVLGAQNKETDKVQNRLDNCGTVMEEILNIPDDIPHDLLDKAECVIVIPSTVKVAVGVGGSYGRGAMVCRSGKAFDGPWGAPAMYTLESVSVGWQLGGEATDFVLLVMNSRGADALLKSKVTLGANASAAAGPKGREATAATNATFRADILSYSRTRGLFAGISLAGTSLRPDDDANRELYGRQFAARRILTDESIPIPESGRHLVDILRKFAPHNASSAPAVK